LDDGRKIKRMIDTFIALGANLGDPILAFQGALMQVNLHLHCAVSSVSSVYRSKAFEAEGPDYLNAVAKVKTRLSAPDLLELLQCIESSAGRVRAYHHQPRTLDLDLLFFGLAKVESKNLQIPHPRWRERAFVLWPLQEVSHGLVSLQDLEAVKNQSIEKVGPLHWDAGP
jgi:2-amino-4-hydroxy-6-hydroxymethyldihydropteridine diphosphokinase